MSLKKPDIFVSLYRSLWSFLTGSSSQELWDSAKFSLIKNIYITQNEIGRGSFGVVYGAVYKGIQCVAKEIHSNLIGGGVSNNTVLKCFIKEINILSTLRHPNVIYFFGIHFREGSQVPVLIIERMWMSLAKLLEERKSIPFVIKVHILHDVACGLKFLHGQNPPVIHRDLTANNILVNKNMDAKITDLGLATALEAITRQRMSTAPGNLAHMPPEALQSNPMFTTRLDIFSFGCVSLHTLTEHFPEPTDQFEPSQINRDTNLKVSECRRRWKYMEMVKDQCTHFVYLISSCLKDQPEYRPDADTVCKWIEEYWKKPEIKQNCSESLIDYFQQDKISLITSLDKQSTRAKDMESTVQLYKAQFQELADSAATKDKRISFLQKQNSDLQNSMESQQLQNEQIKSQAQKFQQDLSQHTDNEIIMNLNTMLRQEQEDMREKQKEIKELKMKLSNLEELSARMGRKCERMEQQLQTQLQALQKKEAELSRNTEMINNQKRSVNILEQEVQEYSANLRKKKDEITELKNKLERNIKTLESENIKKQAEGALSDDGQLNKNTSNENAFMHEKVQQTAHSGSANINVMQTQIEELELKLKHEAEVHMKLKEEMDQKAQKEVNDLKLELKSQEEMLKKETEKFEKEVAYWKAKAEHMEPSAKAEAEGKEPSVDKSFEAKLLAESIEQEKEKLKQQSLAAHQMNTKHQAANESCMKREKQKVQCTETLKLHKKRFAKLKQDYATVKSLLDEKSLCISLLQPQLTYCQEKLDSKDKELNKVLEEKQSIQKLLENMSRLHTFAQEELKAYKETHRKGAGILEKVNTKNVNELLQAEMLKCQDLIREKEKEIALLKETLQDYLDHCSADQEMIKKLEKQVKDISRSQTKSQRQYEAKLKQNSKYIATLENEALSEYSSHYQYIISWSPYMSLHVKRIKPSAVIVKNKMFVTGGYHQLNPQGAEIKTFMESLVGKNDMCCFYAGKYQCDTIDSPVHLGALANVNGQCVLVSGADSVGSTLTGNIYMLHGKASWKKFRKPLPTPRILACACCYSNWWLIVCGGFAFDSKKSSLLEAVSVVEILDTTKGEWYTLSEENCPNFSTILCCAVVGEDMYVVGSDQVIKTSCNKLIKAVTSNSTLVWDNVQIETEESNGKLYPFSVVEVTGEPMIIASMTDGEDDATCVLIKDTRGRWRIMSKAVECQHCSAAVVTSSLELLLFGGSEKILVEEPTEICQSGTLIPFPTLG